MSFWDEVADKAKIGVQKIQDFTLDTVDKVKVKTKIAKLNADVKKYYTRIGELVYEERYGDAIVQNSELINQLASQIFEAKKEISELEEELGYEE